VDNDASQNMMLIAKNTFIFRLTINLQNATLGVHSCLSYNGLYSSNNSELWLPRQLTCRLHPVAALQYKHDCAGFLIDDLWLQLPTHKYIDDVTTISETMAKGEHSHMQPVVDKLVNWSTSNRMNINCRKTKEMIMGPMRKQTVSPVMISEETIEQVTSFELLGVTVTDSLR